MPYIGNPAVDRFVVPRAASVYSGDGSTTAFTLESGVGICRWCDTRTISRLCSI